MDRRARRAPRALFCTDTYPPQVNGVSVVTALSVRGLVERGWEVAVVAPRYPTDRDPAFASERALDVRVTTVPSTVLPSYPDIRLAAPAMGTVQAVMRDFAPDIVHCETEFMLGRLGQAAATRARIPMVTSYHTDWSRYTVAYGVPWLRPTLARYLARFHRRARRTYTPGLLARDELGAMGVREVEVWGRGVDTRVFSPTHRSVALRETWGGGDRFTFVHVGRLAAEKDVDVILQAFDVARRRLPAGRVHLVIAGTGPREEALRGAATEGVSFLGHLDRRTDLPRLYASSDAFLFASRTETLGLVVLEAMASGLPVVAAPAGGVADHLRHDVNGLAYPAGDVGAFAEAMVRLVMDTDLRRRLGQGARRTAEALSWDAELDRLDESYREVIAGVGGTVPEPAHAAGAA